jgi:hypothetical protein
VVPPDSSQVPRDWHYSGAHKEDRRFRLRGYHPVLPTFPGYSAILDLGNSNNGPTTPAAYSRRFRLFPVRSPLLRESMSLSFPEVTEMFQLSPFPPATYVFSCRSPGQAWRSFLIRTSPDRHLLGSSPGLIAAVLRPSSVLGAISFATRS